MAEFGCYGSSPPAIARGRGRLEVLLCYKEKEAAVAALRKNIDNQEFPELDIHPDCEIPLVATNVVGLKAKGGQNSVIFRFLCDVYLFRHNCTYDIVKV